jgi:hypothetical protein
MKGPSDKRREFDRAYISTGLNLSQEALDLLWEHRTLLVQGLTSTDPRCVELLKRVIPLLKAAVKPV